MSTGAAGPAKRVLVIDDSPVNLKITAALIRRAGFIVDTAETAEAGLEQLATEPPDLIVTDLQLPGMDGLDLTRTVKKNPAWKHIPVILLTAAHSEEEEVSARQAGCECSIGKPVDTQVFPGMIRAFLGIPAPAATFSAPADLPIEELRKEFRDAAAAECRELLSQFSASRLFVPELDFVSIRKSLHRWAGVGGTVGLPEITRQARGLETLLAAYKHSQRDELRHRLADLLQQFLHAVPEAQPAPAPAKQPVQVVDGVAVPGVRPVIVVGDDDATIRGVIKLSLEAAGFECRLAADGVGAFTMALSDPPDAIVLDLNMPRLNGFQVLYWLRRQWSTCKVPVIFLTASHEKSDILHGVEMGAASYIVKPFDTNALVARLEQVIAARKA